MLRRFCALTLAAHLMMTAAPAADLPVRKVVLYKHGIGFFERSGRVAAGDAARFDFKASEMNDVLKSLTIEERGAGKVLAVRYESSEPAERKLREFPFAIGGAFSLPAVLDQLKGSKLELRFGPERVQGTIVSGRAVAGSERQAERQELVLLLDSGELRVLDLAASGGVRFLDPKLQAQFQEYLATLQQTRDRDKRGVVIESSGSGAVDLVADYVIPTPAWKSSYRLVFDANAEPMLEGWAIVDNMTGEDWSNVSLSLVSGLPVSFVTRLYEPRYVNRPEADVAGNQGARPVVHGGAIEEKEEARVGALRQAVKMLPMAAAAPAMGREAFLDKTVSGDRRDFASTLAEVAAGRELGDLFEYRIGHPITVRKSESAMLPFAQQRVRGRRLLIYAESYGTEHPFNAVEVQNSTGQTLDGGAITVIDAGAYAGEALMETLKANDKRLISYAVDLGTRITTAFDSTSNLLREFRFRRGVLTTRTAVREVKTFTIRNVDSRAKTLIVETPARPEYKVTGVTPAEKTGSAYRFEVKVASGATEKFPVTSERVIENSISVTDLTPDVLLTYVRNRDLDENSRKKLEPLVALKQKLAAAQGELQRLEKQIQDLFRDQERLRQNIDSLNRVSGQQQKVQDYAQRLAAQEVELAGLRDRQAETLKRKVELEQQVKSLVETLEI